MSKTNSHENRHWYALLQNKILRDFYIILEYLYLFIFYFFIYDFDRFCPTSLCNLSITYAVEVAINNRKNANKFP
jgi:hypothetical protein